MSKNEFAENDITKSTKKKSKKKTENDITAKKWTRTCKVCGKEIVYKSANSFSVAKWNDSTCRPCSRKGVPKFSRNCPQCNTVILHTSKVSLANSVRNNRLCYSCRNSGKGNPFYGKVHTDEHKTRIRERFSHIISTKLGGAFYNETACKYFDDLCKQMNWNGCHAESGGERIVAGYFVDFYDPTNNIVVEYDEPHHEKPSNKKKDIERQNIIIKEIGCRFLRYSEKYNNLYEVFVNE